METQTQSWLEYGAKVAGVKWAPLDAAQPTGSWVLPLGGGLHLLARLEREEVGLGALLLADWAVMRDDPEDPEDWAEVESCRPTPALGEVLLRLREKCRGAGLPVLPPAPAREPLWEGGPAWELEMRTAPGGRTLEESWTVRSGGEELALVVLDTRGWHEHRRSEWEVSEASRKTVVLTRAQYEAALALAAEHRHHWAEAVQCPLDGMEEEEREHVEAARVALQRAVDAGEVPLALVDAVAAAYLAPDDAEGLRLEVTQ